MAEVNSSSNPTASDAEIDRLLKSEATALQREVEVDRILNAFKLNPYNILDLELTATTEDIKKRYRHLSIFVELFCPIFSFLSFYCFFLGLSVIHPDKAKHERAPEAFDRLKKAESELSDKEKRENLDGVIKAARNEILKALQLPTTAGDDHPKLKTLKPPFKEQLWAKSKEMLIDEELRRRRAIKVQMTNEGREAQAKEQEVITRKRKAEDDRVWEDNREERVGSWRSFTNGAPKKKKKKTNHEILG